MKKKKGGGGGERRLETVEPRLDCSVDHNW